VHRPYVNAMAEALPKAAVVFDKFHVLQHASNALDEARRQEFSRAGAAMRQFGRGKRWLLLHRWRNVRGSKRRELQELFHATAASIGRTCCVSSSTGSGRTRPTAASPTSSRAGSARCDGSGLPEMKKLAEFLLRHFDGIAAYCDHPARFGVVESLNTIIKAVLRRARGIRDENMLLLKDHVTSRGSSPMTPAFYSANSLFSKPVGGRNSPP